MRLFWSISSRLKICLRPTSSRKLSSELYILLGQPVDGSYCCEDDLWLCSKNMVLCVVECIPHSFFINSILMFFTVFMSMQSWGSKICTPFCWCKGVCLRFLTKIAEHHLLFIVQPCVICDQVFWKVRDFFGFFRSSFVSSWLKHYSSTVSFFFNSLWLRFGVKKLSNLQTCFWCDMLPHFSQTCKFWSSKANWRLCFSLLSIILTDLLGMKTLL